VFKIFWLWFLADKDQLRHKFSFKKLQVRPVLNGIAKYVPFYKKTAGFIALLSDSGMCNQTRKKSTLPHFGLSCVYLIWL